MKYFISLYLLILLISSAQAEYRVYQYLIQNKDTYQEKEITYEILSTLNPVAYKTYHGGDVIKLDLLRTWVCPGHTGRKEFCPSPYAKLSEVKNE